MDIRPDSMVNDVIAEYPELAPYFMDIGMHCFGCPASYYEDVAAACAVHGVDVDEFIATLREALAGEDNA